MSYVVSLPYNPSDRTPLDWAKKNCPSYITNSSEPYHISEPWTVVYFFSEAEDATMFALRWVGA